MTARVLLACVLLAAGVVAAPRVLPAGEAPADDARVRVEHHLRHADELAQHFETVLAQDCPRFATPAEWKSYFDGEIERVVLLVAQVEQAWVEAKRTGDDDVRREAKAPRKQVERARGLVDKLQGCAGDHGTSFTPLAVWRQIEREVPRRQAEIALPP
jgi:hypothetical protein